MFALQRTLSRGYLGQHPTRSALVVVSIALGVAALVATQSLKKCLNLAARESLDPLGKLADLVVVNGQTGVPRSLSDELRDSKIEGLKTIHPLIRDTVLLWNEDSAAAGPGKPREGAQKKVRSVQLMGVDWQGELGGVQKVLNTSEVALEERGVKISMRKIGITDLPRLFTCKVALGTPPLMRALAEGNEKGPLYVEVQRGAGSPRFPVLVVGSVEGFAGAEQLLSWDVLFLLNGAGEIILPGRKDYVSLLHLVLEPGANPEEVRRNVKEVVGERGDVRTVEGNFETASEVMAGLELGFAIGGAGALVVGLFLVYNVLSVTVAERRHDIGILRSVGATRWQIAGLFLGEAALLGFIGALLGLPLGYLLGWIALGPLQSTLGELLLPLDSASLFLETHLCVLAVTAGSVTAVLAALVPSLQAAMEEPADAVRRVPITLGWRFQLAQGLAVLLLLGGGLGSVWWRAYLPPRMGVFAGVVILLVGAMVATPLITQGVGKVFQRLARRCLGLQARLAADNLVCSPGRTGLVIAALAATGGLMVQTAGFLRSTESAIGDWVEESVAADLFISCGSPVTQAAKTVSMHQSMIEQIQEMDEVETVLGVRFHQIDYRDNEVVLLALDPAAFKPGSNRALARNLGRFGRLRQGGTSLVSENFSALYGVKPGDSITFRGRTGPVTLEVIGTFLDYTWNRGTVVVDRHWFQKEFGDEDVNVLDVWLKPGQDPEQVRQKIRQRWGETAALYAVTRPELQATVKDQLRRIYQFAYAQQIVVGLVALLGVVSALFISVLQRRRELGLLRAVGASRGQILGTVVSEAALMGLLGAAIGLGVGLVLEWYVIHLILLDEAGFTFPLLIPWVSGGVVLAATLLLATLVGLWPAYHATRLRIPDAIAYE